jgi:small subunit ribosomal protein S16
LYLKPLLRGVKLGLFDVITAMQKFEVWHKEHEAQIMKRQEENRRSNPRGGGRRPQGGAPYRRPQPRPEAGSAQ